MAELKEKVVKQADPMTASIERVNPGDDPQSPTTWR